MVLKITPKQRVKINAPVRRTCCNCRKGNCLLLDDGEEDCCESDCAEEAAEELFPEPAFREESEPEPGELSSP